MKLWGSVLPALLHLMNPTTSSPVSISAAPVLDLRQAPQDNPVFVGYWYLNNTWMPEACPSGYTFTLSGTYGNCVTSVHTSFPLPTGCKSSSVLFNELGSSTCLSGTGYCITILIYPNLDSTDPTTLARCFSTQVPESIMYRVTTSSSAGSITAPTPGATATSNTIPSTTPTSTVDYTGLTVSPMSSSSSTAPTVSSTSTIPSSSPPREANSSKTPNDIALGTGIGVGVPAILVAIAAWWFPRHHHRRKEG
ncbi:hypothetical protein K469DRAFT_752732 [Zopfia rhizophila CBS 207.26]|uniref:Uncharacterized protein n=1 Tax=Zopfia rhizophila CBS 207.26 TaxID=1314779 RepID=A0A6A6DRB0_9PEZI|nr:hypothetical protein K469DRAFT_752732 [Zopfia rhizophila CBS 207.26]